MATRLGLLVAANFLVGAAAEGAGAATSASASIAGVAEAALFYDDECAADDETCGLNTLQLRGEARDAGEVDEGDDASGIHRWEQVGTGGCSTSSEDYPEPLTKATGISASACREMCGSGCGAYDYCSGSNCAGNCDLFSPTTDITGSNGYPTVKCFMKASYSPPVFKATGTGGCSTSSEDYPEPMKKATGISASACQKLCGPGCGAYDYCSGSNCDGNCDLFSSATDITRTNGYFGVTCYRKQWD